MHRGETLLSHVREELNRADAKASMVLAACGIGVAAFLGGLVASSWKPGSIDNDVEWLWWLGSVVFVGGVLCIARSVWPTTEPRSELPKLPSYYARIASYESISSMRSALDDADWDDIVHEQLFVNSKIVCKKYELLKHGLAAVLCGTGFLAIAVLVDEYALG